MRTTDSLQEFIAPLHTVLALRIGNVLARRSLVEQSAETPGAAHGLELRECSLRRILSVG